MDCQGCSSGPANCQDTEIMPLPPACLNYKELTSYTRNVITPPHSLCDDYFCNDLTVNSHAHPDWAGPSWYRFTGSAGTRIAENHPLYLLCGVTYGGYMAGGHLKVADGEVERTVYFHGIDDSSYASTNISVLNCREYFIYNLVDSYNNACGYCGA